MLRSRLDHHGSSHQTSRRNPRLSLAAADPRRPSRRVVWTVGPADSVLTALQIMADKNIGFLVVLDREAMVGVVVGARLRAARRAGRESRWRRRRSPDIMVRDVVTVDPAHTFADCLRLMHQHGIRHLPVLDSGTGGRRRLDPRPAERSGRAPRQDHRRARARAADDLHIDRMRRRAARTAGTIG